MVHDNGRILEAVLSVLLEAGRPLGSTAIAAELELAGIGLKERMIRYYLGRTDALGFTENLGRAGRRLTPAGEERLRKVVAVGKVSLISARMDDLAYRMSFDPARLAGTVGVNLTRIDTAALPEASRLITEVLSAGFGMGRFFRVGRDGEELAGYAPRHGEAAVATVCSVALTGVLFAAGIPVQPRFGGLLELREGKPVRFTHAIHYEGTTIDPVEVFIKGRMTSVREAVATGTGTIGASFREIPVSALPAASALMERLTAIGLLGRIHMLGRPGQPLLDIPVPQGKAGVVVTAGLNAIAAVEEAGIETRTVPMASLLDFTRIAATAGT